MNMNFRVETSEAKKVTVTISREALWHNFVNCWRDLAWDAYNGVGHLEGVAKVLLSGAKMDLHALRKLFRDGDTVLFMGDAMEFLDVPRSVNLLREIVVVDGDDRYVISHEHINF